MPCLKNNYVELVTQIRTCVILKALENLALALVLTMKVTLVVALGLMLQVAADAQSFMSAN